MKAKTHNVFSISVLTAVGSFFINPIASLISAGILAVACNTIIDDFGHRTNKYGIPVRTYRTHSFLRGTIYGLLPAVVMFSVISYLFIISYLPKNEFLASRFPYWILLQGLLAGPLHLLLDSPMEGGIFIKQNGRFQRYALAHLRYNDMFWNGFFQLAGVVMLILTFYH